MPTNYFRERAGLPRARNPFRPSNPVVDEAPMTPTFSQPPTQAQVVMEAPSPPKRAVAPVVDPIALAAEDYTSQPVTGVKGFLMNLLKSAGAGFAQGAASNPNDPLAAGLGGALAGGAINAVSPRTGRAFQFDKFVRPGMEMEEARNQELQRRQQQQQDRARAITLDELNRRRIEGEIADTEAATRARVPRVNYEHLRSGERLINPVTGQVIAESPAAPEKPPAKQLRFGRNVKTGRFAWYDAANEREAAEHSPAPPLRNPSAPKPKAEKKYAAISDIRDAVEKARQTDPNMTESRMKAIFKAQGYEIVN